MSRLNEYDYDEAEEGMRDAVERARERESADADKAVGSNLAMFGKGIDDVVGAQTTPALGGSSHIKDAVASLEEPKSDGPKMSDAYWQAREKADAERESAMQPAVMKLAPGESPPRPVPIGNHDPSKLPQMQLLASKDADFAREIGRQKMVEPGSSHIAEAVKQVEKGEPPPTPPDVAPAPPDIPESAQWDSPFSKKDEPKDETSAARLQAIRTIQRLASQGPPPPTAGQGDNDMAAAMRRDQAQRRMDNASEAMAAAFARRPARLMENIGEADILAAQRQGADSSGAKRFNTELEANEKILSALGKPAAEKQPNNYDTPYHRALTRQANALADTRDEEVRRKRELEKGAAGSLESQKEVLARDPRFKAMGYGWPVLEKADQAGVDRIRAEVVSYKPPKGKGGAGTFHGKPVDIKAGNIDSVPERRPGYRNLIAAIADGRMEAPKTGSKREAAEIVSDLLAYKPDFDATSFTNYAAVGKQQATAPDIVAMDVGRHHLKIAKSLIPKGADVKYLNRLKQAFASGSGDPEFVSFNTAANVSAHELARMMKIEDQQGKQMVEHMLAPVQSEQQLVAVFDTFDKLIQGKQEGLAAQLERYLPESVRKKREAERAAGGGGHGGGGHGPASAADGGKVRVSNGKETLLIDASDVSAAEADGFKRVK